MTHTAIHRAYTRFKTAGVNGDIAKTSPSATPEGGKARITIQNSAAARDVGINSAGGIGSMRHRRVVEDGVMCGWRTLAKRLATGLAASAHRLNVSMSGLRHGMKNVA